MKKIQISNYLDLICPILTLLATVIMVFNMSAKFWFWFQIIPLIIQIVPALIKWSGNDDNPKLLKRKIISIIFIVILVTFSIIYGHFHIDYNNMNLTSEIIQYPYIGTNQLETHDDDEFDQHIVKGSWELSNFNKNYKKYDSKIKMYNIDNPNEIWYGDITYNAVWEKCIDCDYLSILNSTDDNFHRHDLVNKLYGVFTVDLSDGTFAEPGDYRCEISVYVNDVTFSDEVTFTIF